MTANKMHLSAAALILLAFVLILWGLGTYNWIWRIGLVSAALAHAFALWVHWAPASKEQRGEEQGDQQRKPPNEERQDNESDRERR